MLHYFFTIFLQLTRLKNSNNRMTPLEISLPLTSHLVEITLLFGELVPKRIYCSDSLIPP